MRTVSVIFEWAIIVFCHASVVLFFPVYANGQEWRPIRMPSEKELTVSAIMYVGNLQLTEGEMPKWTKDKDPFYPHHFEYRMAMYPYVIMDNGEFAIVSLDGLHNHAFMLAVALKKPPSESVRGTLVVPDANYRKMVKLRFEIPTTSFAPDADNIRADRPVTLTDFILRHYQGTEIGMSLESQPGISWYSMQSDVRSTAPRRKTDSDPTTFAYKSMDLDCNGHELPDPDILIVEKGDNLRRVAVDDLLAPSRRQIECKVDLPEQVQCDALASSIPADQWAVFLPNIHSAAQLFERFRRECTRFNWTVSRGGVRRGNLLAADLPAFYEQQLAIDSSLLVRELPATLVKSIAITGSDITFCLGTDVAVLLESNDIKRLNTLLLAHRDRVVESIGKCQRSQGELDGVRYQLIQNQDRSVCSVQAVLDSRIVIANSLEQLKQILEVERSPAKSMKKDQLYTWLRHRYPISDADEAGLLVVTEPLIRRLASAPWRIASARRWVAAAFQKELQARYVARDLLGSSFDFSKQIEELELTANQFRLVGEQVHHDLYGSNAFATPVIEIPVTDVSKGEAEAYSNWRLSYDQLTSRLDPMGARFKNSSEQFDVDISLFPRAQSVYYFNLDLFLGRKFTLSTKSMLAKTLFNNPNEPRILAWQNLLLLNELRRQFPQRDPVETYKQLTGRNIASVPGGHYQWNEHWQSMECSILGCPGSSPPSSPLPQIWQPVKEVNVKNSVETNCNRIVVSVTYDNRP